MNPSLVRRHAAAVDRRLNFGSDPIHNVPVCIPSFGKTGRVYQPNPIVRNSDNCFLTRQ